MSTGVRVQQVRHGLIDTGHLAGVEQRREKTWLYTSLRDLPIGICPTRKIFVAHRNVRNRTFRAVTFVPEDAP